MMACLFITQTASAIKFEIPKELECKSEAIRAAEELELRQAVQNLYEGTRGSPEAADGTVMSFGFGAGEPVIGGEDSLPEESASPVKRLTDSPKEMALGENGRIVGQIYSKETSQPISGAAILIEGMEIGSITDGNGNYTLGPIPAGTYTVSFIKTGYIEGKVTELAIASGETKSFSFALPPRPAEMSDEVYELQDFVVTAAEANELMMKLELVMESDSVLNVMSSEDFSKFAASNIGDAVKRVAGVSVVGGKYAVIRGLGDRYVQTTLNGMPIASPDPDRQAVQLDLFPSGLFEGLEVAKTYMVDRSANSTGAINLKMKDFPEDLTIKVGGGATYHSIATGNDDFLINGGTTSDDLWANGAKNRKLPATVRGGLPEIPSSQFVNDFLAGLIGAPFVTQAQYDAALNEVVEFTRQQLSSDNHVKRTSANPDYGYKVSIGDTIELNDKLSLGFLGSVNYSNKNRMIEDAHYFRASNSPVPDSSNVLSADNFGNPTSSTSYSDLTYDEAIQSRGFSWFAGTGLNVGENHSIRIQRMQLKKDEDLNALYVGDYYHPNSEDDQQLETLASQEIRYSERDLISDQLRGEHVWDLDFTFVETFQLNWGLGADEAKQDDIYFRSSVRGSEEAGFNAFLNPEPSSAADPVIYKVWREIVDEREYQKYDLKFEGGDYGGFASTLKVGYLNMDVEHELIDEFVSFRLLDNNFDELSDLDSLYATSYALAADIDMLSESESYYFMGEQRLFEKLRLIGGSRFQTNIADVQANGDLKLRGAGTNNPLAGLPTEGGYEQEDWYPAATVIYDFTDSLNVRAAYSKTIALPSPREVSPFATNSFGANDIEVGNPVLQPSEVENFDVGFNFAGEGGDSIGVMFFQKKVNGRIERLNGLNIDNDNAVITRAESLDAALYSWYNNPSEATITGVEIEGRKNLAFLDLGGAFEYLSLGGNYAFIDGEVDRFPIEVERKEAVGVPIDTSRQLTEQPEHILNMDLTYDNPERGLRVSLIYYYISDTLRAVSLDTGYDIYSEAYSTLDLTVSQELWENFKVSFAIKNLTNPERRNFYDVEGREVEADSARLGRLFQVSISADF